MSPPPKKGWKELEIGGVNKDAGSSQAYRAGDWRSFRPVHIPEKCTNCMICWVVCPDVAVKAGTKDNPERGHKDKVNDDQHAYFGGFDLHACKGCGVCAQECPFKAIEMRKEKEFKD